MPAAFREELKSLLNCHNMESGSDTPDFILARYLEGCLEAYDSAIRLREEWYRIKQKNNPDENETIGSIVRNGK